MTYLFKNQQTCSESGVFGALWMAAWLVIQPWYRPNNKHLLQKSQFWCFCLRVNWITLNKDRTRVWSTLCCSLDFSFSCVIAEVKSEEVSCPPGSSRLDWKKLCSKMSSICYLTFFWPYARLAWCHTCRRKNFSLIGEQPSQNKRRWNNNKVCETPTFSNDFRYVITHFNRTTAAH